MWCFLLAQQVIVCTCAGAGQLRLLGWEPGSFSHIVVDESCQVCLCVLLALTCKCLEMLSTSSLSVLLTLYILYSHVPQYLSIILDASRTVSLLYFLWLMFLFTSCWATFFPSIVGPRAGSVDSNQLGWPHDRGGALRGPSAIGGCGPQWRRESRGPRPQPARAPHGLDGQPTVWHRPEQQAQRKQQCRNRDK